MGVFLVILASICFGTTPSLYKIALQTGIDTISMLFFVNALGAIIMASIVKIKNLSIKLKKKQMFDLFIFGLIGYESTSLLLTSSYNYIPAGVTTMIHFVYPVIVMVVMVIFFRERLDINKVISIMLAIIGVLFIVDILGAEINADMLKGFIFAFLSSISYALYVVGSDKSSFSKMNIFVILLYFYVITAIVLGIYLTVSNSLRVPSDIKVFVIIPVNLVLTVVGLYTFALGVRKIGATYAAIINILEPAISMILSLIIFNNKITVSIIIGCVLVLSSIIIVVSSNKKKLSSNLFTSKNT